MAQKLKPLSFQPIPYQGSKRKLAPSIAGFFPQQVRTLYVPFAGSAALTLYAAHHGLARCFVLGDSHVPLMDLWSLLLHFPAAVSAGYRALWEEQFRAGPGHFNSVRADYNRSQNPVALLYLIVRCVKNAVRFNRDGNFTQSADRRRRGVNPVKMEKAIGAASACLRGRTALFAGDFLHSLAGAEEEDFVYLDPPYHGTTYGRDRRYAAQVERDRLIAAIEGLNRRGVPFALSYDGRTGDKTYAPPLPSSLGLARFELEAGRSSQATLSGRAETTVESLYLSQSALEKLKPMSRPFGSELSQAGLPLRGTEQPLDVLL